MITPRDYCQAEHLRDKAKRAGFYIDGGWGSITLRALPATAKRLGLVPDADLFRSDSVEAALGWLAGWGDRDIYETMARQLKRRAAKLAKVKP